MKPSAKPWRRNLAAIDTNVLVRLLTQDDPVLTPKAEAYLAAHAPLWISVAVLVETFYVLTKLYQWEKPALQAMLQASTHSRQFLPWRMMACARSCTWEKPCSTSASETGLPATGSGASL